MRDRRRTRQILVEQLEDRRLLAACPGGFQYPHLAAFTAYHAEAFPRSCFLADDGGGTTAGGNAAPTGEAGMDPTSLIVSPEVEPNDAIGTANPMPLGFDPSEDDAVDINGFLGSAADVDTYELQLDGGDILGVNIFGAALSITVLDADSNELISTRDDASFRKGIDDGEIPLPGGGNASLSRVISEPGTYFVQISELDPANTGGAYTAELRLFRPVLEREPVGTHQKLFLDFNGAVLNNGIFGSMAPATVSLSPLSTFLPSWGFSALDEDALIDAIVADVTDNLHAEIAANGENGDFLTSRRPGEFDIEILNSRDHADPWGEPNVSRIVVGGTIGELGIPTVGIAESVDPGNFDNEETAVVLLDILSGQMGGGGIQDLNTIPLARDASKIELVGKGIGGVTSHEAGHYFGLWHTDNSNQVDNLIDSGGAGIGNAVGVGPDGIFGSPDDIDTSFLNPDDYSPAESFTGTEDTLNTLSFGLSTGKEVSTISGVKFHDLDGDGVRQSNEPGLANWLIYSDLDGDNVVDQREPQTMTRSDGTYTLAVPPGQHRVREVLQPAWVQTFPASGFHDVVVRLNESVQNINFGNRSLFGGVSGTKFNDLDGDGVFDQDEPGLPNVIIYLDLDDDNRLDLGEPAARTDDDGNYSIAVPSAGTFSVREVLEPGFEQTFPANEEREHVISVPSGGSVPGVNFGNHSSTDFGDAPLADQSGFEFDYPTLDADNGARHPILRGFGLGLTRDGDGDGQPTPAALGDDLVTSDDEDGVVFLNSIAPGGRTDIEVTVQTSEFSPGRLNAWGDFDRNGNWEPDEQLLFVDTGTGASLGKEIRLQEGVHSLSFDVPQEADPGETFFRFRYGYKRNQQPTGDDMAGEVEDYVGRVLSEQPLAVDDAFSVTQGDPPTRLDVLANDIPSVNQPITVTAVSATGAGGSVLIAPGGAAVVYTPPQGFFGNDSFSYTIEDAAGNSDSADVSVTILPDFEGAIAVDDSFFVTGDNFPMPVLLNDLAGQNPPISIVNIEEPNFGTATLDNRGTADPSDDQIRYTPDPREPGEPGFTDQFEYTISDLAGNQSTAIVTAHVDDSDDSDRARIRLRTTNTDGDPITAIGVGEEFLLKVFVADDIRPTDEDGDPSTDRFGVAGAYLDLLYDFNLVSLTGNPQFNGPFTVATSPPPGETQVPGIVDELGAFQEGTEPLGRDCQQFRADNEIDEQICNTFDNEEFLLVEIPMRANAAGPADFIPDPADRRTGGPESPPDHDVLLFNPPDAVPIEQVRYEGTSLTIVGSGGRPIATDNTFHVDPGVQTNLDVLKNDVELDNPPLRIVGIGQIPGKPLQSGTRVEIAPDGMSINYTPRAGFVGTEQFTYTVENSAPITSEPATVTVIVGESAKDINIRFDVTDTSNNPISSVPAGSEFKLRTFIEDIRTSPPDPTRTGIFAAYFDVLYDGGLVTTVNAPGNRFGFDIRFGREVEGSSNPYGVNGLSANDSFPNLVNETGAFQTGNQPTGSEEFLFFEIRFRALAPTAAGEPVEFVADPADISPFHDVLFFEPPNTVPVDRIRFGFDELEITGAAAAEGEFVFTNPENPFDVDADGFEAPNDALALINDLNRNGSRSLFASSGGAAGEFGTRETMFYLDPTADGYASPSDVVMVINRLNRQSEAAGEGGSPVTLPAESSLAVPPPSTRSAERQPTHEALFASDQPQQAASPELDHRVVDAVVSHREIEQSSARREAQSVELDEDLLDVLAEEQAGE